MPPKEPYSKIQIARRLRKNATDAEQCLWNALRDNPLTKLRFRRQHPIATYIADFACIKCKLVIELDGGQHANNQKDIARTAALNKLGWKVIRFWNNDVLSNKDGVLLTILQETSSRHPRPLAGEGGPHRNAMGG